MKTLLYNLPWSEIFNWIALVVVPTLLTFLKKKASEATKHKAALEAVIVGVEEVSKRLGDDGKTVKRTIKNVALEYDTEEHLRSVVKQVTS